MKYMGSKNRIAKEILPIILANRKPDQWYVEPFVGGANMIDKVEGKRIANDLNQYVVTMLSRLAEGWIPELITKTGYQDIKNNHDVYPKEVVGWAGINCSYSGKWFGGYAGEVQTKQGKRDYQKEALNNVLKQAESLKGITFLSDDYYNLILPKASLIYCDPPYANTTGYKDKFDHEKFWHWCRDKHQEGHEIFISEYNAPEDFTCVWEKQVKSSLSANGKSGGNKQSTEKLFKLM